MIALEKKTMLKNLISQITRFNTVELEGQRKEFEKLFMQIANQFDQYEKYYLIDYIKKYCN